MGDRVNWDDWKLVKAYTDVEIGEAEYRFFQLGLCPDCQLRKEEQITIDQELDKIWDALKAIADTERENTEKDMTMLHQHEKDIPDICARLLNVEEEMSEKAYTNLLGCLTTIEKRTAKLEREMDRVWEVIRCKDEK
jgi:hypothetical protein